MRTLLALLLLAVATTAAAHVRHEPQPLVSLDVIDRDTGQTLPSWQHAGDAWIAGTPGHRYAVRLTNRGGQRVLAVLSVDGVNAVSGETASPQQTGYVLEPYQSTEVAGWRKSLSQIAAFEFTALSNSYAARTGRPDDVGVIGIAVFREKPRWTPRPQQQLGGAMERERSSANGAAADAAAAPQARAEGYAKAMPAPAESLGTGHGAREPSSARQVTFERASTSPDQLTSVRYDSERNLVAMGVIVRPVSPPWRREPRAFPSGFVADPW